MPLDPSLFSGATPSAVYLPCEECAELADCVFVEQDSELPVHSQVVSQHSSVLRGMCLSQMQRRNKRTRMVIKGPWAGHSSQEVAFFLWALYNAGSVAAADFKAMGTALPGVLRLAHQLDVAQLLDSIITHVEASLTTTEQLLPFVTTLEELHLSRSWAALVLRLASLLWTDGSWSPGQNAFRLHDQLSAAALAALLGCLAQRRGGTSFPPVAIVASWLDGGSAMPFTWRVEGYSQLQKVVLSPEFRALGEQWRLCLCPQGDGDAEGTALSVYLQLEGVEGKPAGWQSPRVRYKVVVHNVQAERGVTKEASYCFSGKDSNWGFPKLVHLSELTKPGTGFLVNDCLTISVDMKLE